MQIDGECHCGRISYRAKIHLDAVYLCHCTDCQAISGSPYRWAVRVLAEKFELLSGSPKTYAKMTESGRTNHQVFCPECASPIYSTIPGEGAGNLRPSSWHSPTARPASTAEAILVSFSAGMGDGLRRPVP